jgi:hypothetical protein
MNEEFSNNENKITSNESDETSSTNNENTFITSSKEGNIIAHKNIQRLIYLLHFELIFINIFISL